MATTSRPSRASARAVARPSPRLPPVTRARRPRGPTTPDRDPGDTSGAPAGAAPPPRREHERHARSLRGAGRPAQTDAARRGSTYTGTPCRDPPRPRRLARAGLPSRRAGRPAGAQARAPSLVLAPLQSRRSVLGCRGARRDAARAPARLRPPARPPGAPLPARRASGDPDGARLITGASDPGLDVLTACVFRDFAMCFSDLVSTNRRPAARLLEYVASVTGAQALHGLEGGVVSVTAHVGNWELAGRLLAHRSARRTHVVVAPEAVPTLERWVRRDGGGMRFVPADAPARWRRVAGGAPARRGGGPAGGSGAGDPGRPRDPVLRTSRAVSPGAVPSGAGGGRPRGARLLRAGSRVPLRGPHRGADRSAPRRRGRGRPRLGRTARGRGPRTPHPVVQLLRPVAAARRRRAARVRPGAGTRSAGPADERPGVRARPRDRARGGRAHCGDRRPAPPACPRPRLQPALHPVAPPLRRVRPPADPSRLHERRARGCRWRLDPRRGPGGAGGSGAAAERARRRLDAAPSRCPQPPGAPGGGREGHGSAP